MRNTFHRGISILFVCVVASAVRKLARDEGLVEEGAACLSFMA